MGLVAVDISGADADSYQRLGLALDTLETEASLQPEHDLASSHELRLRAGRTYLFLLGYLDKDTGKGQTDDVLVQATLKFQSEDDLAQTGQLDQPTWQALCELCQYHEPCPVEKYFIQSVPTAPLLRAITLRLFSYGLLTEKFSHKKLSEKQQRKAQARFDEALRNFSYVASLLGIGNAEIQPFLSPATARHLLHHDGLTQGVRPGTSPQSFRIFAQEADFPLSSREIKPLVTSFAKNLATVELWLLGYDTRPGQFRPGRLGNREADDSLVKALKKFCSDRDLLDQFKTRNSVCIGCWFFEEVRLVHAETEQGQAGPIDAQTLNQLECNPKFQTRVAKSYRSLGNRIFDGVKRIFGWFKHSVKKTFKFLKRTIVNLARVLRSSALTVYQRLQSIVQAVKLGVDFYAKPYFDGSDPRYVCVRHDGDLDFDVLVNSSCPPQRLEAFFERLGIRSELFQLACQLVGKLLDLVIGVFRASNLVTGWLALLIALVRFSSWLQQVHALGGETQAVLERLYNVGEVEAAFSA